MDEKVKESVLALLEAAILANNNNRYGYGCGWNNNCGCGNGCGR